MQVVTVAVLAGAVGGAAAGWGIRLLLANLRRGARVRAGILETSAAVVTAAGVGLAWGGPLLALVIWAGLLAVGLGAVDLLHHRLPDALTLPAFPITVLIVGLTGYLNPAAGSLLRGLLVAGLTGGAFWALAVVAPRAMGRGDVKLVPSLAVMTGFLSVGATVLSVALAFVLGAVVALLGMLFRRLTLTSAIPFGPFLLAGCWVVLAVPSLTALVVG